MNTFKNARCFGSAFCQQTFRGFEFFVATTSFLNVALLQGRRPNGAAAAPFLSDITRDIFPDPAVWLVVFSILGVASLGLFIASMPHGGFKKLLFTRTVFNAVVALFYLCVTASTLTNDAEPKASAARYFIVATLAAFASGTTLGIKKSAKRTGLYG